MPNAAIPYIANVLLSTGLLKLKRKLTERKRKRNKQPHKIAVYLSINDAYSYLLLQVLSDFQSRFAVEFDFRCVLNKQAKMYPAPLLWDKNAFNDGGYLAKLYQLEFPFQAVKHSQELDEKATAQLLHWELQPEFLENALPLLKAYWNGNEEVVNERIDAAIAVNTECYHHHLLANENLLKENGHYLSAMLQYGGEWYWGLDRLQYLERRFNELGLNLGAQEVKYDLGQRNFCKQLDASQVANAKSRDLNQEPIVIYWSIRSPYSYIALVRARQLSQHYQVPLVVKPILPMVMRRMQVPKNKRLYMAADAKREANQHGLDFGFIADPLGKGVERCYALFEYAKSKGKGLDYLECYARSVWSQGVRSETDGGLKKIVENVDLDWKLAKEKVQDDSWRIWAQQNLAEFYGHDLWGVPSFKYRGVYLFGQDRVARIEQLIVERLTGNEDADVVHSV